MNIKQWAEKTSQVVKKRCLENANPCIGFSLCFYDAESQIAPYSFVINLAFDPHNPPEDEERAIIEESLQVAVEHIAKIMGGEAIEGDDPRTWKQRWVQ